MALARQVAMELCYRFCSVTQREIGDLFNVDYSTVSQNRKRLKIRLEAHADLREKFRAIIRDLENLANQKI